MDEISAQRKADELRRRAARARDDAAAWEREAAQWAQGAEGERITAAALAAVHDEATVLHDRLLQPGVSEVNLDHVIVSRAGVFLVDSKHWSGQVSVYEANLWQHLGGTQDRRHHPKHGELDKVSRAAAAMERALSGPVVPVLCLAAPQQADFQHERVRGVEVMPATGLAAWVRAQPPFLSPAQVELTARRVATTFPPAIDPVGTAAMASTPAHGSPGRPDWKVPSPRVHGASRSRPRRTGPGRHPRRAPNPSARQPRRGSALRVVFGLIALLLLISLLPRLTTAAGALISRSLTTTVSPASTPPTVRPAPGG